MKLLVADEDRDLVDLVHYTFMQDGLTILSAADGETAARMVDVEAPDLILLNQRLPKRNGVDLLAELRQRTNVPIIMMTATDDDDHLVNLLQMGADDCLVKPLRTRLLRARVHALLRRTQAWNPSGDDKRPLEIGGIILDPRTRRVTVDDKPVHLSRTEFALLEYLMRNHGSVVRLPQLVANVWGYDGNENENVVKVAISRLRRKVELDPALPRYIVNVPGVGYMFQNEVAPASKAQPAAEPVLQRVA